MRLQDAASFFDDVLCADTFTPATTFYGQLDLYDDSKRDGATVARRVLSVDPAVVIPARKVITFSGEQWIVGTHESDSFQGSIIRDKWIVHRATGAATVRTPAETLAGSGGISTYAARMWVKDQKEIEISSTLTPFFNIYFPTPDAVLPGHIVYLSSTYHIVRNVFPSIAGFKVAESDEAGTAMLVAGCTYTPRTYVPSTDAYTSGTPVALSVLSHRFQSNFELPNAAAEKLEPGDIKAIILKSAATPAVKGTLTVSGVVWRILDVQSEDALCWSLHLRKP